MMQVFPMFGDYPLLSLHSTDARTTFLRTMNYINLFRNLFYKLIVANKPAHNRPANDAEKTYAHEVS